MTLSQFLVYQDEMEPILALQRKVLSDMYAYKMPSIMIETETGVVHTTWPPLTPVEQQLVTTLQDLVTACAHRVRTRVRKEL